MKERVLIVEQNGPLAELWAGYLRRHGFEVMVFIDGRTETSGLREWGVPDILVCGVELGGQITAADLCLQLFGEEMMAGDRRERPLIRLYGGGGSGITPHDTGVMSWVRKPVTPSVLLDAVRRAWFHAVGEELRRQGAAAMTVDLGRQPLAGVLAFIGAGNRTGVVIIETGDEQAVLSFADGRPVNARCGGLTGAEAVLEALSWSRGQASFYPLSGAEVGQTPMPGLNDLLAESQRQGGLLAEVAGRLTGSREQRLWLVTGATPVPGPMAAQVRAALKTGPTWLELRSRLGSLTERQVRVVLGELLAGGELSLREEQGELSAELPEAIIAALVARLRAGQTPLPAGRCLRVYGVPGGLVRRFLGLLSGRSAADAVMLAAGGEALAIVGGGDAGDGAVLALVVGDWAVPGVAAEVGELLNRLKRAGVPDPALAVCGAGSDAAVLSGIAGELGVAAHHVTRFDWSDARSAREALAIALSGGKATPPPAD